MFSAELYWEELRWSFQFICWYSSASGHGLEVLFSNLKKTQHIDLMATPRKFCYVNLVLSLDFEIFVANINPLCCCRCHNFRTWIGSYLIRFSGFVPPSVWLALCIRKQTFYIPLPTELSNFVIWKKNSSACSCFYCFCHKGLLAIYTECGMSKDSLLVHWPS